jgi:hypothetical protein
MTDDELQSYVGCQVELKLTTGTTLAGELVAGANAIATGSPYAIRSLHASAAAGAAEPVYAPVSDASAVESVRLLNGSLGDDRLED